MQKHLIVVLLRIALEPLKGVALKGFEYRPTHCHLHISVANSNIFSTQIACVGSIYVVIRGNFASFDS